MSLAGIVLMVVLLAIGGGCVGLIVTVIVDVIREMGKKIE